MTGSTLTVFRTALLKDGQASTTEFPDNMMDRAVERAVQELSKFLPYEKILDVFIGDRTVTDETFTSDYGVAVSLSNSPIQGLTEKIRSAASGGGTLYVLGTDYEMNFFDGTVTVLSTGSMADSTIFYATYEKNGIVIDISGASNIMEVLKLEHPLTQGGYQEIKSFQLWGTKLFIGAGDRNQEKALENKNLWMYYYTQWDVPVAGTGSNYPAHLDELVTKGALGFLYLGLASKQYINVASELALANAELDSTDTVFNSADGLHAAITIALDAANAALDSIAWILFQAAISDAGVDATDQFKQAVLELAAVATEGFGDFDTAIGKAGTTLTSADASADSVDDTKPEIPLDKIDDEIRKVTDSVEYAEELAQINLAAGVDTYLANTTTEPAAHKYLIDGDALINVVNQGENASERFVQYAAGGARIAEGHIQAAAVQAQLGANRVGAATAFIAEGNARIANERLAVDASQALTAAGNGFISEAESRLSQHRILLSQAQGYIAAGDGFMLIATTYVQQNLAYVREAEGYIDEARSRTQQHEAYLLEVDRHISDAGMRLRTADGYTLLGKQYEELAAPHTNEFFDGLRERQGMRRQRSRASRAQPKTNI